ncbi:MAG: PD-(D/E)XK nuclease family protein [Thermoguttaceae bacterium]|nr:PD-(D/E)XK nuclease family protein [Thermoguttaceae bacterium]
MKRIFFNWDRPFLPAAAEYIVATEIEKSGGGPATLDLGKYVCVLPGQRAIRTLEAYLQQVVEREIESGRISGAWIPPNFQKLGAAPERIYTNPRRVADHLTRLYCMRKTVDEFFAVPTEETRLLMKSPSMNLSAQLELADSFLKLKDELDSERQTYARVAEYCLSRGLADEARRWEILEKINAQYEEKLKANKLTELNKARMVALAEIEARGGLEQDGETREFRIIGAVDLNNLQKSLFSKLGDNVEFWVFAPEEEQDRFDEFGCVVPEKWADYQIPLDVEQVYQASTPAEQGEVVALLTRELSKRYDESGWTYEPIDPYSLTIGTPDSDVIPFVEQKMNELGYETILGEGASIVENRVYKLLLNLADYLEKRSFSSFEELLRRVDLEDYLRANWGAGAADGQDADAENFDNIGAEDEMLEAPSGEAPIEESVSGDWIAELDDYRARYLPTRVDGRWFQFKDPDNEKRDRSFFNLRKAYYLLQKLLYDAKFLAPTSAANVFQRSNVVVTETSGNIDNLKPDFLKERDAVLSGEYAFLKDGFDETSKWVPVQPRAPLNEWAKPLSDLLCAIYDSVDMTDRRVADQVEGFFKSFNKTLSSLAAIPDELAEKATGADAIRVVLQELANARIDATPESEVVEMQGWLDLLFDDAPNLILTGFNEGVVPSSKSGDLFLPNETRTKVGVTNSQRVYARDAYLATALIHSRRNMYVVLGKTSLEGDPKLPSRFLFATSQAEIPNRVVKYFDQGDSSEVQELRARNLDAKGQLRPFPRKLDVDAELDSASGEPALAKLGFRAPNLDVQAQHAKKSRLNLNSINVTDFQTFLESPYQFFLRKVFALNPAPDPNTFELDAGKFGTVIHDVLRLFGESDLKDSTNEFAIVQKLSVWLDEYAQTFVNNHTSPFVVVQLEQIRSRLHAFARWQAAWRKSGREIKWVEHAPKEQRIPCVYGNKTFWINGRIDRIDYCPAENRWYLFDYKTFDTIKVGSKNSAVLEGKFVSADVKGEINGKKVDLLTTRLRNTVDMKHRAKAKDSEPRPVDHFAALERTETAKYETADELREDEQNNKAPYEWSWTNLQLPLYRRLFWQILYEHYEGSVPMEQIAGETNFSLAYIVLPKSDDVQALGGPWNGTDLHAADATALWVVGAIKRLFQDVVVPNGLIDSSEPGFGRVLDANSLKYDDFAPITLSYVK